MERQKGVKTYTAILFHIAGAIGFFIHPLNPLLLYLVSYHLLLMLFIVFYTYGRASMRLTIFFVIIFIAGFFIAYIGVHTSWLFGRYMYDDTLGYKLASVPFIIGVNWFLLIFPAGALMQKLNIRKAWLRVVMGAATLTLVDMAMEPIATKYNYWHWLNGSIPLKNYVCWFLISILMLWLFELFRFKRLSYAGPVLLITQFLFFIILRGA
jgi:putative membrane protein